MNSHHLWRLLASTASKGPCNKWTNASRRARYGGRSTLIPNQTRCMSQVLPKLPIPPLRQSLDKYLRSIKPLVDDEDFKHTEHLVEVFSRKGGHGDKLQSQLVKRSAREDNWLEEWWLNSAYLDSRLPIPIISNPGVIFYKDLIVGNTLHEQLKLAARAVSGLLDFKAKLDGKRLPVEKGAKGRDLDMSQYGKLLNSCRVPGSRRDKIVNYSSEQPRHICVAHNNHFFYFDVIGEDGQLLNRQQIYDQLEAIVKRSSYPWSLPLGIMTSENRSVWGGCYERMMKNRENRRLFDILNRAIFVLCLDQRSSLELQTPEGGSDADMNLSLWAGQMLHGGGSSFNSGNRWFDKTLQLIIATDGAFGINYEHSPTEGLPIMTLMDYVTRYCEYPKDSRLPSSSISPPEKMKFVLPNEIEKLVHKAKQHLDISIRELDLEVIKFQEYGKSFVKGHKLSPDSFIQMALQVAFYRMHNEPACTYESASTRIYSKGRTDTIRSCSIESLDLCKAMVDNEASTLTKVSSLSKAIAAHQKEVSDAVEGQAYDRHLLGLKMQALENGENIPDLFMDVSYFMSSHFKLSTSQVPSTSDSVMCYGPAVPDGYGVCYNAPRLSEDCFNVSISSYFTSPQTSSVRFGEHLVQTLVDFKAFLEEER